MKQFHKKWCLSSFRTLLISSIASIMSFSSAVAEENTGWHKQITPYIWATGMDGNITPFPQAPTLSVNQSFSDTIKDLDAAFFLHGFARKERFVFMGDMLYANLSKKGNVYPGISAKGKLKLLSLTFTGGYRVLSTPSVKLDTMAGVRLSRIQASVDIPQIGQQKSSTQSLTDPILALRANFALDPNWSILAYGDIGGFGAGSKMTKQAFLSINYKINNQMHLSTGYRHLHFDVHHKGMHVDTKLSGPFLGLTWQF